MQQPQGPLRRLLAYMHPHRHRVWMAVGASIFNKLFDLAPPVLIGMAVDIVVQQEDSFMAQLGINDGMTQLTALAALTLVVWILESIFDYINQILWRNLAQTIQHDLRLDAYQHVQGLEMAYFEDQSTGGLMAILNDDVNQLERFLDVGATALLKTGVTVVAVGIMFFLVAPQVAWMLALPMPLIIWGSFWFQKKITPRYAAVREQVSILNGQLANNLGGIATIKSFTAEDHEVNRMTAASNAYRERNAAAIRLSSAFGPIIRMAIVSGFIAIMIFGGRMALDGTLNIGIFSAMVLMTQRFLWPLVDLGQTFDLYQRAMASTARVLDLLDTQAQITDGSLALDNVQGAVQFENVRFAYSSGPDVLRGLTLDIPAGDTAAIVGATGAGKSTVIKLLLRFYDVTGGRVLLDGENVQDIQLPDLRRAIGLVSQDVFLFHGTVRENIAYGTFDATDEQIIAAAQIAEAHEFIMALPQGYNTIVGERGQKLSGGQRQRISIARAVLKDAPILILDEATSAVDTETELLIQQALEDLMVGRTTIVIAHRLSTIRNADKIVVLEGQHIVEAGTHDELLALDGLYTRLVNVQQRLVPAASLVRGK